MLLQVLLLLNSKIECSLEYFEDLSKRLELIKTTKSLNSELHNNNSALFGSVGSNSDNYNYWNEHVTERCSPQSCPSRADIEREVVIFPTNSDKKDCSCQEQ